MKKFVSAILLFSLCTCLFACGSDKDVPSGMQKVSGDDVPYNLYVPGGWIASNGDGIYGAYYSQSDKSSITVSSYSPTGTMASINDYWQYARENYENTYKDFAVESSGDAVVFGGKSAFKYTFTASIGGAEYHFMQVIAVHSNRFFILTYTSDAEHYDAHLEDVEQTISEFVFK